MNDSFSTIITNLSANTISAVRQMDRLHTLLALCIGLFVFALILLCILGSRRKIIKLLPALLASLFLGITLFLPILASSAGTILFMPDKTPDLVSEEFMTAVVAEDAETVSGLYPSSTSVFPQFTETDETSGLLRKALSDSYSYQFPVSTVPEGTRTSRTVSFTSLNISSLTPDVLQNVNSNLENMVKTRKRSEIYDGENYLPEVLDEAYTDALNKVLKNPDKYYTTTTLSLNLSYEDGKWAVYPEDRLKTALAGGIPAGTDIAGFTKSEVLGDLTYIPKIYTIEEGATFGPRPNPDKYGSTKDPADIAGLIKQNPALTGNNEPFFHTDSEFIPETLYYYADDTILTYTWREILCGHTCTFAEVYIADPSQFRRKLSGDAFGSPIQKYASEMAKETNSVVAMNGDFYKFRAEGMTVYNRELYRFNPYKLELCHVDSLGHLNFTYAGELKDADEAKQYVKDHDILFTLAFGPVLVDNYEPHASSDGYLLGQVTTRYSRSVLCTGGDCHYLLMTINHGYNPKTPTVTIAETQEILLQKHVENAYVLDGGQTAEIIMQDRISNHIDFNTERTVSDILYFVTALPEDENN